MYVVCSVHLTSLLFLAPFFVRGHIVVLVLAVQADATAMFESGSLTKSTLELSVLDSKDW